MDWRTVWDSQEVFHYLRFQEPDVTRSTLNGVAFRSLSVEDNLVLTSPVHLEEIYGVVFQCDGNKCPGRGGFNFSFFKMFGNLLRRYVGIMFDEFQWFTTLLYILSYLFVIFIPMIKNPNSLGDFRPISLVRSLYKLFAKDLDKRLGVVMEKIINHNQSGFLKGSLVSFLKLILRKHIVHPEILKTEYTFKILIWSGWLT